MFSQLVYCIVHLRRMPVALACMGAGVAETQLDPRLVYSCLSVVVKGAQSPTLPRTKGQLYEALLELLYQLAAAPLTGEGMLALLQQLRLVPMQLDTVLAGLLAEGVRLFSSLFLHSLVLHDPRHGMKTCLLHTL